MSDKNNFWKHKVSPNPFKDFFKKIKFSIQRAKYGFCDWDVWDLDYYFSGMIPAALRELAKTTNGYPASFEDEDDLGFERWKLQLNHIADLIEEGGMPSYEVFKKEEDMDPLEAKKYEEELDKKFKEGMYLFTKYFHELWW